MKKKKFVFIKELAWWLEPRFCLTDSEKKVVLLILFILWTGLTARLLQLHKTATVYPVAETAGLQLNAILDKVNE